MTLNWLDIAIVAIMGVSVIEGIARGFARVGVGLAAAVAGVILGIWFYGAIGYYFLPYVSSKGIANFIGFLIVFAGCLVVGAVLGKLLGALFKWAGLTWMDRILGALFGFVRGLVGAIALVLILTAFSPKPPPASVAESRYAPYLIGAAGVIVEFAPREVREGFLESYEKLKEIWDKAVPDERLRLPETQI